MPTTKKETAVKKEPVKKVTAKAVILSGRESSGLSSSLEGSVKTNTDSSPKAQNDKKPAKSVGLSVAMYSLLGKEAGSFDLPKSVFGAEINKALLSQALRVYMNNLKGHHSNTKTRGQVEGSTRKIYAQKGTGRARHGGIRAPLFVGGGIAHGPKYRKTILDLPKKMKKAALISALSQKHLDNGIFAISGLEKATGKTSELSKFLTGLGKKSVLIVSERSNDLAKRAAQNLKGINLIAAEDINTFEVIKSHSLIFTKGAVEELERRVSQVPGVPKLPRDEVTVKKARDSRGTPGTRGTSKEAK